VAELGKELNTAHLPGSLTQISWQSLNKSIPRMIGADDLEGLTVLNLPAGLPHFRKC
jgi:hypothetical protein